MGNSRLWTVVLMGALALGATEAWAKRLGGGLSIGQQSGNVAQRNGVAPAAAAAKPASAQNAAQPAAAAAPAAAPGRGWGGVLGGVAAGLGLAWLASSLGLGEGFAQFLLVGLLLAAVVLVVRLVLRRRAPVTDASGLAYQTAAAGGDMPQPASPRGYSPRNVGNDASARPWETQAGETDPAVIDAALGGWTIPADFDVEGFLQASKTNFIHLQAAWDRSDVPSLRAMMTDGMLEQIQAQLADRERSGASGSQTEVVMLDARLLGIEELESTYMASVEFSGLMREEASAGPNPFREVWNITRPRSGQGGWLVAGVQAMD
ncbi:MAG: Tim44-like domain-containing protein [Hydrogenophaga sp.]|nr:Tim44-like domain-containing protein [Hydrogenophaga sp.]